MHPHEPIMGAAAVTTPSLSADELKQLHYELQALARAIRGAPAEGNHGMLQRLEKVERKVTWLVIAMIPAVTAGTAVGKVFSDWIGL